MVITVVRNIFYQGFRRGGRGGVLGGSVYKLQNGSHTFLISLCEVAGEYNWTSVM